MRLILHLLLAFGLVVATSACGDDGSSPASNNGNNGTNNGNNGTNNGNNGTNNGNNGTNNGNNATNNGNNGTNNGTVEVESIELTANITTVAVGQGTAVSAVARAADGSVVDGVALSWSSSSPDVASVETGGIVRALAEGTTEITASVGTVTSNLVSLTIVPAPEEGDVAIRIFPPQLVLAPGQTSPLAAVVRDASGSTLDVNVTWHTGDSSIATVGTEAVITASDLGTTEVWASWEDNESARHSVVVTDQFDYLAVEVVTPDGSTSADSSLDVEVLVQRLPVGSIVGDVGTPVQPDSLEVYADGTNVGTLTTEFGGGRGSVDVSGVDGSFAMSVTATVGGESALSTPVTIERITSNGAWQLAGEVNPDFWREAYGESARAFISGGDLYLAANECGRECSLRIWRFDPDSRETGEWRAVEYVRREYRDADGTVEEVIRDNATNVDLPRYVGWGWPSADARHPHTLRHLDVPMVAYSNRDARTSFNLEDEPEHYWFDCYVVRWNGSAGYDGNGGWDLLSSEDPDFLSDLPHPNTLPEERGEQRHPAGADVNRTDDCSHPKMALEGGDVLLAYISTPIPDNDFQLRVRRWNGSTWTDSGPTLPLSGLSPVLYDMVLDSDGRVVVAVDNGNTPRVYRQGDSDWTEIAGAPDITVLRTLDGGGLLGASLTGGDARVYVGSADSWAPLGSVLDRQPWAPVREIDVVVHNGRFYATWVEGGHGSGNVFAAEWVEAEARWASVGDGALDVDVDRDAFDVQALVDDAGHLIVRFSAPNDPGEDLAGGRRAYVQRVRRTNDPVAP